MLAMGRGLMLQRELLLLDEPLLGLAPILRREVLNIVERIHEINITILFVEYNAKAALQISERGYVLETEKSVMTGKAEYLLRNDNVRNAFWGF